MKKNLTLLVALFVISSCAPEEDYPVPAMEGTDTIATNVDLDAILGMFYQKQGEIISFNDDLIFEGFVVSSDEAGNHYKELIIQDRAENPLGGVTVKINMTSYFQFYNFGRKIFINLNGLSIGTANGVATLGIANGKQIDNIPQSRVSYHLTRSSIVADIVPLKIEARQFNDRLENIFVEVEDVQFSRFLVDSTSPFTFASEDNDEFDGERMLESCSGDFPFLLSTSTYANFSGLRLPSGSGSIKGILTRDYYDEFYTIYLNYPSDLNFNNSNRCDPTIVDCGIAETTGTKVLFEDDFTAQKNNKPVTGNGWTNFVQEGSRPWEAYTASGANASLGRSIRMRPAGSGDQRSVSWLITPGINFDKNSGEVLSFKTSTSFANGSLLEVFISTDWDGKQETILDAQWDLLSAAYVAGNNDYFGDWMKSGDIDLSCVNRKAHIAFRYTGSDMSYYNGIYELDEVVITAQN